MLVETPSTVAASLIVGYPEGFSSRVPFTTLSLGERLG
jgi:hypothetical protein